MAQTPFSLGPPTLTRLIPYYLPQQLRDPFCHATNESRSFHVAHGGRILQLIPLLESTILTRFPPSTRSSPSTTPSSRHALYDFPSLHIINLFCRDPNVLRKPSTRMLSGLDPPIQVHWVLNRLFVRQLQVHLTQFPCPYR